MYWNGVRYFGDPPVENHRCIHRAAVRRRLAARYGPLFDLDLFTDMRAAHVRR